jgi:hypothetical protein
MPKLCQFENCKKQANYGTDAEKKIFCREHKTDETRNMSTKICKFESCKKQPVFNLFEEKKGLFCNNHKLDGMVNVVHAKCLFLNCKTQSCYNFEGEKKSKFCSAHKVDGMIDIKIKRCEFNNCKSMPNFNYEGIKIRRFCSKHKLENMVDIGHPKCCYINCNIQPIYNYKEETKAKFCFIHKIDDMIDIKHKNKCKMENCFERSYFNFEGEKTPEFCSGHKLNNMIDVLNSKCACGNNWSSFNFKGLKPQYCSSCKTQDMINVKHVSCKNDGCPSVANKKYKNYCAYCFQYLFPLDPLTFQIKCKTKELAVRDFINANYEGFNHDKILEYGGCDCLTRRRIDHRKIVGNTLLCVETDENQHKSYSKEDEEDIYNDLLVNFTCKYIVIRFNPDSYVNKKGVKTNPYISARLEELKKEMDKQLKRIDNNENDELLEVVHLYYDGYK